MADGNFLPEEDQVYLRAKTIPHSLLREMIGPQEDRRGIEFPDFQLPANLFQRRDGQLVAGGSVSVLVLIPKGYAQVRLDSWYVSPPVFLANGSSADRAGSEVQLFGRRWQFWSRHLQDGEWRAGIDGLETYLQYVHAGLRNP